SRLGRCGTVSRGLPGMNALTAITEGETRRDVMTQGYTDYEKPLTWNECKPTVAKYGYAEFYCYSLLYRLRRLAPAFGKTPIRILDHAILSALPALNHYAGLVAICLVKR